MNTTKQRSRHAAPALTPSPTHPRQRVRGRPPKDQVPAIDAEILKVATEMFGELGYTNTSMEAIAAKVGIAKRTLYVRYPDKIALFKQVIDGVVTAARHPDPNEFHDMRACLMFHANNYFLIRTNPALRVICRIDDDAVQNIPELAKLSRDLTHDLGIRRIAASIVDTAHKMSVVIENPEFIATSLVDLATGHFNRARVLSPNTVYEDFALSCQQIVDLLATVIEASLKPKNLPH